MAEAPVYGAHKKPGRAKATSLLVNVQPELELVLELAGACTCEL
jgi:hypothetical protein